MNNQVQRIRDDKRILGAIALAVVLVATFIFFVFNRSDEAQISPPSEPEEVVSEGINETPFPLSVPAGFRLEVFAEVEGARVLARDGLGNFWVSQPREGTVSMIDIRSNEEPTVNPVFRGLRNPHGLAIDPANGGTMLYIAEEHRIVRVPLYSDGTLEEIAQLPSGGGHFTRTMEFGPDG
ncbi:MAG: hypothetical protein WDZ44_01895, partial [Candidatus Spechtbacterales bacterium]